MIRIDRATKMNWFLDQDFLIGVIHVSVECWMLAQTLAHGQHDKWQHA